MTIRVETDSFGELNVPADKYWGAQTQRSLKNFPIGWENNRSLSSGHWVQSSRRRLQSTCSRKTQPELGDAIVQAASEVYAGKFDDHFHSSSGKRVPVLNQI